jgi:hypothetical protein
VAGVIGPCAALGARRRGPVEADDRKLADGQNPRWEAMVRACEIRKDGRRRRPTASAEDGGWRGEHTCTKRTTGGRGDGGA